LKVITAARRGRRDLKIMQGVEILHRSAPFSAPVSASALRFVINKTLEGHRGKSPLGNF
jgi:hypothetical protein